MLYIFMADGFEEVEAVATIDVIRRSGIEVLTVSVGGEPAIKGAHGMTFVCDKTIEEVSPSDELEGVILPGGMPGTLNLQKSKEVNSFIDLCAESGKLLCAICAAPMILGRKGLLQGRRAVCFPGFEDDLIGAIPNSGFVCTDGNFITAKGMGCAVDFGLAIVVKVKGQAAADLLRSTLQCP